MISRCNSYFISVLLLVAMCAPLPQARAATQTTSPNEASTETIIIGIPLEIALPSEARDVVIGDPALLDAAITSSRRLVLTGKSQGLTTLSITDRYGANILSLAIRINTNLDDLRDIIRRDLGLQSVEIRTLKQAIVIGGAVPSSGDADKVIELVKAYFGLGSSDTATAGGLRIMNTMRVTDREQVMLRVVVSEVQRSLLKQLGVDTQGTWSLGNFSLANAVTFPTTRTPTSTLTPGYTGSASNKGTATLNALERAGYLKTLAEPTLTAISGESAKFTAGGEIPVPTGDICSTNAVGTQSCQTSYGYKPIGVTLSFTPLVLSSGRISLHIITEVTEIDNDNGSRTATGNIPAFRSRKMDTTVELASGAALMSAGLIQQQSSSTYDRVPGVSSIPVLGQLFQSNDYQNHQTELLISVVPYIAKPNGPLEPGAADDEFHPAPQNSQHLVEEISTLFGVRPKFSRPKIGFEVP